MCTILVQEANWQLEDYAIFKKCGEITVSPDEQFFGLNCVFCSGICLQFDIFMQHIREQHSQDIEVLYLESGKNEKEQITQMELDSTANINYSAIINSKQMISDDMSNANNFLTSCEFELQTHAPQEEVDLVYIMEGNQLDDVVEERSVGTLNIFNGLKQDNNDKIICSDYGKCGDENCISESMASSPSSENQSKSSTTPEMKHSKEIIDYILDAYKNKEKLWNPDHSQYKYNANRRVYDEFSAPLLKDMNYSLSGSEIFSILKNIRSRYRRELTKFRERGGKYKSKLWFFEKLHFLRNIIEKKRAVRDAKNRLDSTESDASIGIDYELMKSIHGREVLSYLIEAFRNHEILWNPQHENYTNCNKSSQYEDISIQLREDINVAMSGEECFESIQKLRTRYRKELYILLKNKGLYVPKLWCFEQMNFLRQIFEEQIRKKTNKQTLEVETKPKTKFLRAEAIIFKNVDENLQFIEIYKNYSALWDVDHPDFRSTTYRNEAHNEMLEEINLSFKTNYSLDQLQKTIHQLRKDYSTEKQKIFVNNSKTTNSLLYTKLSEFLDINLGPFRCDFCKMLIKTSDQYKIHKSGHDGTLPFICTLCGKGFQMPGNLTVHIRRHKRDFPYACDMCDKNFATATEMAIHKRKHTGERPYICDLCGKSFKTWSFFDIHRRIHVQDSTFHCPICDKNFYEKNRFTNHMNIHLNIRNHKCNACNKSFTTIGNLKKHKELHLPVKKYKCEFCSKRFAQFASLRWHKRKAHLRLEDIMEQ
ncbi:zinc finger protein 573 [Teleopsis dalmanni]|uniref:zinc finger protein 573 n=1 Tax=Teleopsis dalmanni TaxID=139649 RepID=UPI0018CE784B|nr:zinc finger protein 573 [Teleopsis dalmanni]